MHNSKRWNSILGGNYWELIFPGSKIIFMFMLIIMFMFVFMFMSCKLPEGGVILAQVVRHVPVGVD